MTIQQLDLSGKPVRRLEKKRAHQVYTTKTGEHVPGCSGICKLGDSLDGLMYWAYSCGRKGIDFTKARDEAAEIGTVAHFFIECFLTDSEPDVSEYSPYVVEIARNAFAKFTDFWEAGGYRPLYSELQMASTLHRYGGTLDCIALDRDDAKCLFDFKATSGHWPSHGFQLAGYRNLFEENNPGEKIERFCVVRIPKQGDAPADPKWFPSLDRQWWVFQDQLKLYYSLRSAKDEGR